MRINRIIITILICLLLLPVNVFAITYGKVGADTNFNGDVNVPSGSNYYKDGVELSVGSDKTLWIYPQDYATGTGTDIDPWAGSCIEDAYTACPTGGTIYLRAGYYQLAGQAIIAKAINIIGEGISKTFIVTANDDGLAVTADYVTLKGFTIDGAAQTDGIEAMLSPILITSEAEYILLKDIEVKNGGYYGINIYEINHSLFQNIYSHDNYRHGLHPGSDTVGRNKYNTYRDIYSWDNGVSGLDDRGTTTGNEDTYNVYDNLQCWDNGYSGISIDHQNSFSLTNSSAWGNGSVGEWVYGILIDVCNNVLVNNCISIGNDKRGMNLSEVNNANINNCFTSLNTEYGINLEDCNNVTFTNVIVKNNNTLDAGGIGGVLIDGSNGTKFNSCQIYDDRTPKLQVYGIVTSGVVDTVELVNCKLSGNLTGTINNGATASIQSPDMISELADVTSADADYMMIWDATDSSLKKVDMAEVRGGAAAPSEDEIEAYIFDADAETITGNWDNTANPWADNEVSDTLTASSVTGFTPAAGTLTLAGADALTINTSAATDVTLPTSGTLYGTLADSITSANLLSSVSDETGTGVLVFGTSPTFTTNLTVTDLIFFDNTTDYNIKLGYQAGKNIVSGAQYNTFIGYQTGLSGSGTSTNAADYNTAIGASSLKANTTGNRNVAIGLNVLMANTTGANNFALGNNALTANTTGSKNCAIGASSGQFHANGTTSLTDPENSVYIGYEARGFNNSDDNSIVIGYQAIGTGANKVVLGNSSITQTTLRGALIRTVKTLTKDDATPDVSAGEIFLTVANDAACAITDLDLPTVGQIVTIICGSSTNACTITDGGNFALSAAWTPDVDDVITLFVQEDNDYIEISRSAN